MLLDPESNGSRPQSVLGTSLVPAVHGKSIQNVLFFPRSLLKLVM